MIIANVKKLSKFCLHINEETNEPHRVRKFVLGSIEWYDPHRLARDFKTDVFVYRDIQAGQSHDTSHYAG